MGTTRLALGRVKFGALGGLLREFGFAQLLARELFGLARFWVEYFLPFSVFLWLFCGCHVEASSCLKSRVDQIRDKI